ncbi:MAG: DUF4290 domain-containing protein, partial [Bacteroidales bacterium]|nr:DUF4290 domain-containing protein [Bacteroidales bacterium]
MCIFAVVFITHLKISPFIVTILPSKTNNKIKGNGTEFITYITSMEYNTDRRYLDMPEYGRNIQKMIKYTTSIEDNEKRLKVA